MFLNLNSKAKLIGFSFSFNLNPVFLINREKFLDFRQNVINQRLSNRSDITEAEVNRSQILFPQNYHIQVNIDPQIELVLIPSIHTQAEARINDIK